MKTNSYTFLYLLIIAQLTSFTVNAESSPIYGSWTNDKLTLIIGEEYCFKNVKRSTSKAINCNTTNNAMFPLSPVPIEYRVVGEGNTLIEINNDNTPPLRRITSGAEATVILDLKRAMRSKDKNMFMAIIENTENISDIAYICHEIVKFSVGFKLLEGTKRAGKIGCMDSIERKFMHSVGDYKIKSVRLLLDSGVDVDTKDRYGMTALVNAVNSGRSTKMIEILLKYNPDLTIKDKWGRNVIEQAEFRRKGVRGEEYEKILKILNETQAK